MEYRRLRNVCFDNGSVDDGGALRIRDVVGCCEEPKCYG